MDGWMMDGRMIDGQMDEEMDAEGAKLEQD